MIDSVFSAKSAYYWSSTTDADYTNSAWRVDFDGGGVSGNGKHGGMYARCVRGGQ